MKKITTIVNFILDESGSMEAIRSSVISGFNEYVGSLKKQKNKVLFTLTKFDSTGIRIPYVAVSVKDVEPLSNATFRPGETTPLYDAVVNTIKRVKEEAKMKDGKVAVLVAIMTDGLENASKEHTQQTLTALIQELTGLGNWTFVFLGANQDSWATAQRWGIPKGNIVDWQADAGGTMAVFSMMASSTASFSDQVQAKGSAGLPIRSANFFNNSVEKGDDLNDK